MRKKIALFYVLVTSLCLTAFVFVLFHAFGFRLNRSDSLPGILYRIVPLKEGEAVNVGDRSHRPLQNFCPVKSRDRAQYRARLCHEDSQSAHAQASSRSSRGRRCHRKRFSVREWRNREDNRSVPGFEGREAPGLSDADNPPAQSLLAHFRPGTRLRFPLLRAVAERFVHAQSISPVLRTSVQKYGNGKTTSFWTKIPNFLPGRTVIVG